MEKRKPFRSLNALNRALSNAPPYIRGAGRIVPGEGPVGATIAFVGEQPGDQEDRDGAPFTGPAGKLLYRAMRGPMPFLGRKGYVTGHPSAILRMTDPAARQAAFKALVSDLREIRRLSEAVST